MTNQYDSNLPIACVVLPTYNEAQNIAGVIKRVLEANNVITSHNIEILVVDDNSLDNTQDIVKKLMKLYGSIHMITGSKRGLGDAYKRGFSYVFQHYNPDLIIQMDADGQHDPLVIPELILLNNSGYDVVIGSRFIAGSSIINFSIWRKSLSVIGNILFRLSGGLSHIKDCTSGFRSIKSKYIKKCELGMFSTKGYSFQSSLIYELNRIGAQFIEYPIVFNERKNGDSKLALTDQIEFILNLIKINIIHKKEFIKYCLVGLSGGIINILAYLFFSRYLSVETSLAPLFSMEISILSNFVLNNFWTFNNRPKHLPFSRRIISFHLIAGINGLIFYYLLFLFLQSTLGLNDIISIIISIFSGTLSNYILNSHWTWKFK